MSFASELKRLQQIADAPPKIAAAAAPRIAAAVDSEFAKGADPYGDAWADLAKRTLAKGRFPPPLTETGFTKSSAKAIPEGAGIRVTVDGEADWHQHGTGNMPARTILPTDGSLPDKWNAAIVAAAKQVLPKGAL